MFYFFLALSQTKKQIIHASCFGNSFYWVGVRIFMPSYSQALIFVSHTIELLLHKCHGLEQNQVALFHSTIGKNMCAVCRLILRECVYHREGNPNQCVYGETSTPLSTIIDFAG